MQSYIDTSVIGTPHYRFESCLDYCRLVVSDFPEEWNSHFGQLVQMATDSEGKSYKYVGSNPILATNKNNTIQQTDGVLPNKNGNPAPFFSRKSSA